MACRIIFSLRTPRSLRFVDFGGKHGRFASQAPAARAPAHLIVPALYVDAQGAVLGMAGGRVVIRHRGAALDYPAAQVDRVLLFGNVQISTQAMAGFLEAGVPVLFLSARGRFRGRLAPAAHANVRLRMRQYEAARQDALALPLARWFVIGKIRNNKEFLCRRLRDAGRGADAERLRASLKSWMDSAGRTRDIERLRGFEGMAAREYFQGFGELVAGAPFRWNGRNRQPPRDPLNAMLSLGYTLLLGECVSAIEALGMDVHAGFLHGGREHSEYGKPALALDLMEEFRWWVDRLVVRLALGGGAERGDFERTPSGGVFLKAAMRKRFFAAWEERMNARVKYDHRRLSCRAIVGEQAARLARALEDEDAEYRPFMP